MKYLVAVDDFFLESPNGAARVAWDLALAVQKAGGEVGLASIDQKGRTVTPPVSTEEGVRILKVVKPTLPAWSPRRLQGASLAVKEAVETTLGQEHWDVLHIHSVRTGLGVLEGLKHRPPRVLSTAHSPIVSEYLANNNDHGLLGALKSSIGIPLLWELERKQFQASDAIHVLSLFSRQKLRQFHPYAGKKVTVIPSWKREGLKRVWTKEEARKRLGWPVDETIFFTLRNHSPRNGLDIAIQAISPFAKAGECRFYVGGSGMLFSYHQKLVEQLGVAESILLTGRLSDEDLELAYQAADMFILPTRALECFGLIILEALSFGCPVLGADISAIPELLQPILPDFLFAPDDVEAMKQKVRAFLEGRLLAPPAETLVSYVTQFYSRDVVLPRMLNWIEGDRSLS